MLWLNSGDKVAFTEQTKVFTEKGWKNIGALGGRDRVLVRNFLGDAEFIQPFALKKKLYEGDIYRFGNREWAINVTPNHKMVYNEYYSNKLGTKPADSTAESVKPSREVSLYRSFHYMQEAKSYESITMRKEGFEWRVNISIENWYTILAYTMLCAYIDKRKSPHIMYISDNLQPLTNILDMIGIQWTQSTKNRGAPMIFVRNDSNLLAKLLNQLGARERRDMKLQDKHIFAASSGLLKHFVHTLLSLGGKPIVGRPGQFSFSTVNKNLIENLEMICMLGGYGFSLIHDHRGYQVRIILSPPDSRIVTFVEKNTYSGYTYEIDLFDGLIYVTEKKAPVWMAPK